MSPEQEQEILTKCRSGALEEFGQIYDWYVKKIYRFIYYKTFNKPLTEDLTSQTFLKTMENIQRYDPAKGNFSSWLYRIARNVTIDHFRTEKKTQNIDDLWDLQTKEDVASDVQNRLKLAEVKGYLRKLKPIQQEVVLMRVWGEYSHQEIATNLGISEANCKMIFIRTIKKLQKDLLLLLLIINLLIP